MMIVYLNVGLSYRRRQHPHCHLDICRMEREMVADVDKEIADMALAVFVRYHHVHESVDRSIYFYLFLYHSLYKTKILWLFIK